MIRIVLITITAAITTMAEKMTVATLTIKTWTITPSKSDQVQRVHEQCQRCRLISTEANIAQYRRNEIKAACRIKTPVDDVERKEEEEEDDRKDEEKV